ncbi:MAG: phospholipase [Holophagaceae bacterium]|nr:phospholipase [Holophagaceae bacterium]
MPTRRIPFLALLLAATLGAQVPRLVQSIPEGTGLAQADLPFAKDVWPDMIRGAKRSIDLAEFYVSNAPSSFLEPVLKELEMAGARGVKVRIMLSALLLAGDPPSVARLRAIPGAELRVFDFGEGKRGILHAKYFIVDGEEAFVGSQNLDWRSLQHIHETGLRFRTPSLLAPLRQIFEIDWEFCKTRKLPLPPKGIATSPPPALELVASPPGLTPPSIRAALPSLIDLLDQAKTRVRVQLLTYSPVSGKTRFWPALDNALRAAAVRGVAVQLLVSDWNLSSPAVEHLKSLGLIPNIEVRVASIPDSGKGHIPFARVIHSKYMTVDGGLLWLGTSNWSEDYFEDSRNVELILRDAGLAAQGDQIFEQLWNSRYASRLDPARTYIPRARD